MNLSTTSSLNYVVTAALVVWVLTRQLQARPVVARKLFVLPVILVIVGIGSLDSAGPKGASHFTSNDGKWLAIDLATTIVFGLLRGASIRLYAQGSVLWRKGTWLTLGGWLLSFGARALIGVLAANDGASVVASSAIALSFGVSLGVQGAGIYLRGMQAGVPFASDPGRARTW